MNGSSPHKTLLPIAWLLLLAIVAVSSLLYPLKLNDQWILTIRDFLAERGLQDAWVNQWEPFFFFGFSPLVLKEKVSEFLIILLFVVYLLLRLTGFHSHAHTSQGYRFLLLLLVGAGISILYSPTFYYSMASFFNLVCYVLLLFMVAELSYQSRQVNKLLTLLLGCSFLIVLIALGQHLGLLSNFFPAEQEFRDIRNRMGSLIGHNTGLSMFLYPALFIPLALLTVEQRRPLRIMLLTMLILTGLVYLLAQSRGSWLILLVLLPLFLIALRRHLQVNIRVRNLLLALLVFILMLLSQIVENPLKVEDMPFRQRLRYLTPEALRKETRLRILICSLPLLARSPLWGYGIGSFQYVYPRAQADYFTKHPHTLLAATPRRTQRAHNEPLQLLIELGLLGLLLLVLAARHWWREGWHYFQQTASPHGKALRLGIGFSLLALLVHSLIDFPFHVAPVALNFCLLLGLWISPFGTPAKTVSRRPPPTSLRLILLLFIVLALVLSAQVSRFIFVAYSGDMHYSAADSWLRTFYDNPGIRTRDAFNLLRQANRWITPATRIEPLNSLYLFERGQVQYLLGKLLAGQAEAAAAQEDQEQAPFLKETAIFHLKNALSWLQFSLTGLRFHSSFYLLGLIYEELHAVTNDENYARLAIKNYREAVRYSPVYGPAIYNLAEFLDQFEKGAPGEIRALRRRLKETDPQLFHNHYLKPLERSIRFEEYERALHFAHILTQTFPEKEDYFYWLTHTTLREGTTSQIDELLVQYAERFPESPHLLFLQTAILARNGKYQEALQMLNKKGAQTPEHEILLAYLKLKLALPSHHELWKELETRAATDPSLSLLLGELLYYDLNDQQGIEYLEQRTTQRPPPDAALWFRLGNIYDAQGDVDRARALWNQALQTDPNFSPARRLLTQTAPETPSP